MPALLLLVVRPQWHQAKMEELEVVRLATTIAGCWCMYFLRRSAVPAEKRSLLEVLTVASWSSGSKEQQAGWFWLVNLGIAGSVGFSAMLAAQEGHYLNAISGALLITMQPLSSEDVSVEGDFYDMVWFAKRSHALQAIYNAGFTLWTLGFAYNQYKHEVGGIVAVASCAAAWLYFGGWQPQLWVQARLHAMLVHALFYGMVGEAAFANIMPVAFNELPPAMGPVMHYATFGVCAFGAALKAWW
eukprot:TRINITY_DN2845_c0_g2_i2.p2 TRINITY_DN2845_c0_g2~~TRINITY_DN2845_c0_g2_i2.p2  ORF type:complete len:244 (+),score=78.73 TRINITY_DN2845_c0_g2_i2:704-1435(+)